MADKMTCRTFPTAFKLAAIKRLKAGQAVLPLARELGVSRKILHDWRKAWDLHGPAGLNQKRGPKPGPRKLCPLAKPATARRSGARKPIAAPSLRGGRRHQRVVERRRRAVRRIVLVGDPRQPLARFLGLALPVPHAGIESP
jgi:transposase